MDPALLHSERDVSPRATAHSGSSLSGGAEDELHCFFANSLGMLCVAGFDGFFKRLNPAWSTTLGWTLEELQRRPLMELVHPDDRAATRTEMTRLMQGASTVAFEIRYRCKSGSYKWLEWHATSLPCRRRVCAMARDITRSKGLAKTMLETSDREKERLGRELHDGLCQNLAGIAALSSALSRRLAADSPSNAKGAREITELLHDTIDHARDMARGLNPVNLERIGIAAALENLASNVEALFRISCDFRCHGIDLTLDAAVEAHLFRIAQEAVNNAISHGRGTRIEINLSGQDGRGRLSIRDDGVGFGVLPRDGGGAGLHTMNYRARLIGGSLDVSQRTRRGTKVICTFILKRGSSSPERSCSQRSADPGSG